MIKPSSNAPAKKSASELPSKAVKMANSLIALAKSKTADPETGVINHMRIHAQDIQLMLFWDGILTPQALEDIANALRAKHQCVLAAQVIRVAEESGPKFKTSEERFAGKFNARYGCKEFQGVPLGDCYGYPAHFESEAEGIYDPEDPYQVVLKQLTTPRTAKNSGKPHAEPQERTQDNPALQTGWKLPTNSGHLANVEPILLSDQPLSNQAIANTAT